MDRETLECLSRTSDPVGLERNEICLRSSNTTSTFIRTQLRQGYISGHHHATWLGLRKVIPAMQKVSTWHRVPT